MADVYAAGKWAEAAPAPVITLKGAGRKRRGAGVAGDVSTGGQSAAKGAAKVMPRGDRSVSRWQGFVRSLDEAAALRRAVRDQREALRALRDRAEQDGDAAHYAWAVEKLRVNKSLLKRSSSAYNQWRRGANKAWAAVRAALDGDEKA